MNDASVINVRNRSYKSGVVELLKKVGLGFILRFYYKYIKTINLEYFENKILDTDVLVIGGGNMIFDLDKYSFSASRFDSFISIAKKNGIKVFAISLGIGPFQTRKQESEAVKALEKCDYISFRDKASYEIFKKYNKTHKNVYVSIDPVFLIPQELNFKTNHDSKIGLNIINNKLLSQSNKDYMLSIERYVNLAEELAKKMNKKIILFSTESADYEAVEDVYKLLKTNSKIEIRKISSVSELLELYSEISVLIGTRMHSMIIAHSQQIPVIGLSWQSKVDSMFDIIESKESLFRYDQIDAKLDKILECTKIKIENLKDEKQKIKENLMKISKRFDINKYIIQLLIQELKDKNKEGI